MLFLIEYDRPQGSIIQLRKYDDASRGIAEDDRLSLELRLNREGVDHEIVILEAPNEEALRRTHSRYFESVAELARNATQVQAYTLSTPNPPRRPER